MVVPLGFGNMLDTVEFFRKSWGQLNLPAAFAPTMDVEELDRRIKDLKAVEQWLTVNMNLLRGTIQTMEVQRGTIAAISAFGKAMTSPAPSGTEASREAASASPAPRPAADAAGSRAPAAAGSQPLVPEDAAIDAERARASGGGASETAGDLPMMDPTAWWNLLQQQFQQVAGSALTGAGLSGLPGMGGLAALSSTLAGGDKSDAVASAPADDTSKRRAAGKSRAAAPSGSARKAGAKRPAR